jgi:hypothetical protein
MDSLWGLCWSSKDKYKCTLKLHFKIIFRQVPVAHTYNPSYSGCKDQGLSSKLAWANISTRPYLEKPFTKIGLVEWLKVKALSSSPHTKKKLYISANITKI